MRKNFNYFLVGLIYFLLLQLVSVGGLYFLQIFKNIRYKPIYTDSLSPAYRENINKLLNGKLKVTRFDSDLGWNVLANSVHGGVKINSLEVRSNREYSLEPKDDVIRISTYGDSFTFGDEINNEETFQNQLENMNSKLEVLNFGVGGYGIDQAYLRYSLGGKKFKPDIVLIGFAPMDTMRSVNVYRPFFGPNTGIPLAKPRFLKKEDDLLLLKNPAEDLAFYKMLLSDTKRTLHQLGKHDYYFKTRCRKSVLDFFPHHRFFKLAFFHLKQSFNHERIVVRDAYNPSSEAYLVTAKVLEKFYKEVIENGSIPIIAIFPYRNDMQNFSKRKDASYEPYLKMFKQKKMNYIDFLHVFRDQERKFSINELFMKVHYSPLSHEMIARFLDEHLKRVLIEN